LRVRHPTFPLARQVCSRRTFLRETSGTLLALAAPQPRPDVVTTRAFYSSASLQHKPGPDHPESPTRLDRVATVVRELERRGRLMLVEPRPATEEQLLLVHSPLYVQKVRAEVAAGHRTLSTGDTEISEGSFTAALAAAGAATSAVDAVMTGRARCAFCAVRPPGHHASGARGMGFCVFNNIAVAARYARRQYGVDRILIADWDVHHGNGTQAVFWRDGSVLFFDTHQHPWYPGTGLPEESGEGNGRGLIVNRPFPAGAGGREILGAFRQVLVPAAERFKPQLVMISAGFDSRQGDPLGRFTLTDRDFAELTDIVVGIASLHAGGRVISVLEGGYSLDGLQQAVNAHLDRLTA
jgi:acetoin utilization deacetylase AcuC-like enzyme